jgi:hypothetical protein
MKQYVYLSCDAYVTVKAKSDDDAAIALASVVKNPQAFTLFSIWTEGGRIK